MANLIKSNFVRLIKNPLLWISIIASTFNPLYTVLNNYYYGKQFELDFTPDDALVMVANGYIFPIVLSVLITLFIGTEYSDKTIRNRLVVGHSRFEVYLSNLIICLASAWAMYAVGVIVAVAAGVPLLGNYAHSLKLLLPQLLCAVLSISALVSITVLLAMLISNRVISSVVALLLSVGLAYVPTPLWDKLYSSFEGATVTGWKHTFYQITYDLLPTCQLYQYSSDIEALPKNLAVFPIYSILIIVVTSAIGLVVFKKKNLK